VRPDCVVVDAPGFDRRFRVDQIHKPVFVQAFVAKLSVEALDIRVLDRLTRPNEAERDAVRVRPRIERAAGKLRPVVDGRSSLASRSSPEVGQAPA
jgi:hypothetical protein